jgi:hypothetical protein
MSKYQEFPDGFVSKMTGREMSIIYEALDFQVHELIDRLLEYEGDSLIRTVSDLIDTPELAVRALKLNMGRTLPRYEEDYGQGYPRAQVGETRVIEPRDEFVVVGGPYTNYPRPSFSAVLHRAAGVEAVDPHTRLRLSCNDFAGIAMAGV